MAATGPLSGLKILDLSRILAGPTCTQILGDLGADVIKIEKPGTGDDTRAWGPPYVKDADGKDTTESAYYLSANRNKRSLSLDITKPEGQQTIRQILGQCDVLIHNFKVGGLEKYDLGYGNLKTDFPKLIYCAITGFGQTGPYAPQPGYDLLAQAMGGLMSITGPADGDPHKVGVATADIYTGLYASISVLAALRHRDATGVGQMIDLGLLDVQAACLANVGLNHLTTGAVPKRLGNGHPSIVPYEVFPTADGFMVLAVGNDSQYKAFCALAGCPDLATDTRFVNNRARVDNRTDLIPLLRVITKTRPRADWIKDCAAANVPCGPVNTIDEVFADPQIQHRGMRISIDYDLAGSGSVDLIGSPIKMSETPVTYRTAPPYAGQHTDDVLTEFGLSADDISHLRDAGAIE